MGPGFFCNRPSLVSTVLSLTHPNLVTQYILITAGISGALDAILSDPSRFGHAVYINQ